MNKPKGVIEGQVIANLFQSHNILLIVIVIALAASLYPLGTLCVLLVVGGWRRSLQGGVECDAPLFMVSYPR